MNNITLIGIDLNKPTFHIHCQDKLGHALLRKKFTRTKLMEFLANCSPATVVMEACAGAHFMARRIADLGHDTKLISPQFVKAIKIILLTLRPSVKLPHVLLCALLGPEQKLNRQYVHYIG